MKDVDIDGNNELDFEEFKELVKKITTGEYGFIDVDQSKMHDNFFAASRTSTIQKEDATEAIEKSFGVKFKSSTTVVEKREKVKLRAGARKVVEVEKTVTDEAFENRIKAFVLREAEQYIKLKNMEIISRDEVLLAENRRLKEEIKRFENLEIKLKEDQLNQINIK